MFGEETKKTRVCGLKRRIWRRDGINNITVPIRLKHQASRRKLLLTGEELAEDQAVAAANENLIMGLAKAHVWLEMMSNGEVRTVQELADKVNIERSYVTPIIYLVDLAPGIQRRSLMAANRTD